MSGLHIFSGDGKGEDLLVTREDGTRIERIQKMVVTYEAGAIPVVELTMQVEVVNLEPMERGFATHSFVLSCCGEQYKHECDGP